MNRIRFLVVVALLLVFGSQVLGAGHVETIASFSIESGELTEGVTVDADGNVFMSFTPLGQVVKLAAGTDSVKPFGQITGLQEGDLGMLGVAVNDAGDVYGAVASANPDANGLWKFDAATAAAEHVPGTEAILLANAIAFGDSDEIYVTDSVMGAVWIIKADGSAEVWLQDALLTGTGVLGLGVPVGANGIDVHDGTVYVGVTELASIVAIPIMPDGTAGAAAVWAQLPAGNHVDGIVLDDTGNVIVAAPTSNLVLRVDDNGSVEALATVSDGLDAPASVAYHVDEDGNASIYASNFSIAVNPPGGSGPALLRIDAGPME